MATSQNDVWTQIHKDFIEFCKQGDFLKLQQLVQNEKSLNGKALANIRDEKNFTPLHWAALQNHLSIARYLLENKLVQDVNDAENESAQTPLHWACIKGHIAMTDLLIEHNATIDRMDKLGTAAVIHAAQNGHTLLVHYLCENGGNIKSTDYEGHTALHWAAYQGHMDTVLYLIRHGCPIQAVDVSHCTALHWSIVSSHVDIAKVLVESGIDISVKDGQGVTALQLSRENRLEPLSWYLNIAERRGTARVAPRPTYMTQLISWIFPMIAIPLVFYSFVYQSWYMQLLVYLSVGALFARYNPYFWPSRTCNSPAPTSYAGAIVFYLGVYYFLVFMPAIPEYGATHAFLLLLIPVIFYCHFKTTGSDAGKITPPKATIVTGSNIVSLLNDGMKPSEFCATCLIRKPLRSKHCKICDCCIARFDHHCPWIYNCVGMKNHLYFVALLFLWSVGLIGVFYMANIYTFQILKVPLSPLFKAAKTLFWQHPDMLVVLGVSCTHAFWISLLCIMQLRAIMNNITTNEHVKRQQALFDETNPRDLANVYDVGLTDNVKQFLQLEGHAVDWTSRYPSLHESSSYEV